MSKHTPGPWTVELDVVNNGDISVFAPELLPVASIDVRQYPEDTGGIPREIALANARLIAESPSMYAIIRRLRDTCPEHDDLASMAHWLLEIFKTANEIAARVEGL